MNAKSKLAVMVSLLSTSVATGAAAQTRLLTPVRSVVASPVLSTLSIANLKAQFSRLQSVLTGAVAN